MRSATASRAVMISTGTSMRARRSDLQHLEAVLARQPEVEHREVVGAVLEAELGRRAVAHPVDRVAVALQAVGHGTADHRVVFHHQHTHGSSIGAAI